MKTNTCNYSDEWQPYIGDYDKFEYDIKLKDGTVVENCYPNGGEFSSISELHNQQHFNESEVTEIRFSENPRFGINEKVSNRPQYEWLDKKMEARKTNPPYLDLNEPYILTNPRYYDAPIATQTINTDGLNKLQRERLKDKVIIEKIDRNSICPKCDSGKKYKKCCINK